MAHGRIRAFLIGGTIGTALALLFAPRSGSETRALLTDKAEELWGEGTDLYSQGYERVKAEAANVQKTAAQANDELREKIENARNAIAEQVAKNAQSARDAINAQVPATGEKIEQTADVLKGKIDSAASKLKTATSDLAAKDAEEITKKAAEVEQLITIGEKESAEGERVDAAEVSPEPKEATESGSAFVPSDSK